MGKTKKNRNILYWVCSECALHSALRGESPHWRFREENEGRCESDSMYGPCPMGFPFAAWYPVEELPTTIEDEIEQGEEEDYIASVPDIVDHYKSMWERYKIPHNQFTEEEYEE